MKPAVTNKELTSPLGWHEIPQGEWLKALLEEAVSPCITKVFGYYMLALGPLADELDLSASSVKRVYKVHEWAGADLRSHISQLPFKESSVDACVMPFCLDYATDPHQLLREAHRVVIPEGNIILAGFNPYSLLLAGKLLPGCRQRAPWDGRFFSQHRVKDWLQLLGCEIVQEKNLGWSSLIGSDHHSEQLQRLGEKYFSCMGSVYLIHAKKREIPLTPAKPVWKKVRNLKPVGVLTGAGVAGRA